MASLRDRIKQALLLRKLITEEKIDEVLAVQKKKGGSFQRMLIDMGLIKEEDLVAALSEGLGIPPISLARCKLPAELKALIPRDMAIQYQIVPVSCLGQTLNIAMADPLNVFALDTVSTMTGLSINPLLATYKDVRDAIDQFYGTGVEETLKEIVKKTEAASIELLSDNSGDGESESERLLRQTQEAPVVKFTDLLLTKAVRLRASDLLIEPREKTVRVRYRVDGILQEGEAPPKQLHSAIVSRIKIMSELDISERRLPQDSHFTMPVDERLIDFRVSILPSAFGGNVCLRVLDKGKMALNIDSLGFAGKDLGKLKACALRPHGMILSTGPTGSGKTTTLYSLLKLIDSPAKNLITVEDPVEFDLEGVNQVNVKSDIGLTFAKALRSILRQDPDVIMIGEIRDTETADMAVKAALTGHLVLSTLHTNSAAGCIVRLVNMGIEPFLLNSCLMAAVGQRLVRKVCMKCAERYQPAAGVAAQLGLLDDKGQPLELIRGKGCRACSGSGYSGREVIAESLIITPEIRELVLRRAIERDIENMARKQGMRTLREQALAKVAEHHTSLEEVFRTTIGDMVDA